MNNLSDCLSAKLQFYLTTWRNPEGPEENWAAQKSKYKKFPQVWTIVKCEGAYFFLAGLAALEYTAGKAFSQLSLAFSCLSERPHRIFSHWSDCSRVAMDWALANMIKNLTEPNMNTTPENFLIEKNRSQILVDHFSLNGEAPL